MKLDAAYYDLLMDVSGAMFSAMGAARRRSGEVADPPPPLLQMQPGRAESPGWYLVQAAEFDPEPLNLANLRIRDTYAHPRIVAALLAIMAGERWLDHDGYGNYRLGEQGATELQRIRARQRRLIEALEPLPSDDLDWIARAMERLISASLAAPTPPGSWCLAHSRRRAPDGASPVLQHVGQYCDDFNAFRDDAHMAAWQPLGLEGFAWEGFTLIRFGAAATAQAVFEILVHRGYAYSEHCAALDALVDRGWLARDDTSRVYAVTETGNEVWAGVEARTDQYFYAPWSVLAQEEQERLHGQLTGLRDRLAALSA